MADSNLFQVELVTPERILLSGAASEIVLRTGEGDTTFLAGHTPLVGTVEPGVVRVTRPEGEVVRVAVHGGFVQVEQHVEPDAAAPEAGTGAAGLSGTRVTVLAGVAELSDEIDTTRAQADLEAAEAEVAALSGGSGAKPGEDDTPDAALVEAEAAASRARVRLEAADATAGAATAG